MASSASGKDVIGYPSGQDGAILPAGDYPLYSARKNFTESHVINPLLTKFVRSRWLDVVLSLPVYGPRRTQKKNSANIQPS